MKLIQLIFLISLIVLTSCTNSSQHEVEQLSLLKELIINKSFGSAYLKDGQIVLVKYQPLFNNSVNDSILYDERVSENKFLDVRVERIDRVGNNIDFIINSWIDDRFGYIWTPDGSISISEFTNMNKIRAGWFKYDTMLK